MNDREYFLTTSLSYQLQDRRTRGTVRFHRADSGEGIWGQPSIVLLQGRVQSVSENGGA